MAIKLDLTKAYDKLRWSFIHETLIDIGLPTQLIHLIIDCITSTTMQVLWDGEAFEAFKLEQGVRQGDPLSP